MTDSKILIDWDKFSKKEDKISRNDKIEFNMNFSYWLYENGLPETE